MIDRGISTLQDSLYLQSDTPMVAFSEHPEMVLIVLLTALFLYYLIDRSGRKRCEPTNWPLIGMLPGITRNLDHIHDKVTEILCERGGTFWFRGIWFCNSDLLVTSHPDDIQHIFNKNFTNYPKGPEFRERFETLGDSILSTDSELWEVHRKGFLSVIGGSNFYQALDASVWGKIESGLIPVMNRFCETGAEFDLKDIFQRFAFDTICKLVMNQDPSSLSLGLPTVPCQRAFEDVLRIIFQRHMLPRTIWKMKQKLKIGNEKKLLDAWKQGDEFIYSYISACENDAMKTKDVINLLPTCTNTYQDNRAIVPEDFRQFLRDSLVGWMFAGSNSGGSTLTWLLWLLSGNPSARSKILEEMERELGISNKWRTFTTEESRKLVYLQAAISESLRLFPPVALQYKSPIEADTLPSGHDLRPNTKIIISFYSIGRMEKYWGKDCLEYKPERWITSRGTLKSVPTYMFPAFNLGPRVCPGKEMAFAEMKMVAATLLYHYDINVVEGQQVTPEPSVILHAKQGVKVVLSKKKGT